MSHKIMTRFDLQALVDARTQPVAGRHGGQWESQFRALPSNRPQGFLDFEATAVFQGVEGRDLMGRACVSHSVPRRAAPQGRPGL
jgi:hypothetical protein